MDTNSDIQSLRTAIDALLSKEYDIQARLTDLGAKRILLRADLNVPVDAGRVADATRIKAVLPTIQLLQRAGAKVIVASHLGRPSPKKQTWEQMKAAESLAPVASVLADLLAPGTFVGLAPDCIGPEVQERVDALQPGQVVLLENTRLHAGDTANDPAFSRALASLADVYVCDAFGVVHRDQGSVTGVVDYVAEAYPGPLVRHELKYLGAALDSPKRPFGVVIGGAKVADKIGVLWSLLEKADVIVVGGRMAFTFLAAQGVCVGATQIEEAWLEPSRQMCAAAAARGVQLLLPCDVLVSPSLEGPPQPNTNTSSSLSSGACGAGSSCCASSCIGSGPGPAGHCAEGATGTAKEGCAGGLHVVELIVGCCTDDAPCVPPGCYGVDIGPRSAFAFSDALERCNTIFWNGPMGKFEVKEFGRGTEAIVRAVASATARGAVTVVGGGDSVAALNALGLGDHVSHVSTGGGASLELVEGRGMPGLRALVRARHARAQQES